MSVDELIIEARALPRSEQLQLIKAIRAVPLTPEEELILKIFPPDFVAEVWCPEANGEAAEGLLKALEELRTQP